MRRGSSDECRVQWREQGNMKRNITVLTLCAMLLAPSVSAHGQQPKKVPRIGYLSLRASPADAAAEFK